MGVFLDLCIFDSHSSLQVAGGAGGGMEKNVFFGIKHGEGVRELMLATELVHGWSVFECSKYAKEMSKHLQL